VEGGWPGEDDEGWWVFEVEEEGEGEEEVWGRWVLRTDDKRGF